MMTLDRPSKKDEPKTDNRMYINNLHHPKSRYYKGLKE